MSDTPSFTLERLTKGAIVSGILPSGVVTVVQTEWFSTDALELTYRTADGKVSNEVIYRDRESDLEIVTEGRPWSFDGDGALFRLVSEANRIRLAYLFDPVLAVHTSDVQPLPHQITAVYEAMLPRQPLRFLLADDPGAGKTIMAGLLIRELIARGDLKRCLIVCPGSLAEQWQDELWQRFNLSFEILTNDKLEASRTGNWFIEEDLVIARLDKLSRNEDIQEKLQSPDCRWDLIVCDEAHKMSASYFGNEKKETKRYKLGQLLSTLTRHFLLMTATPHNGKEADFQLFMALLDGDRFEGKFRDGVHSVDVSDLLRRMVKEELLKFDGRPLFPERIAKTVPYELSDPEAALYAAVTEYVRNEFNRAESIENGKRKGTVGFALTVLQRRLASSPEAIYQSLKRRRERLESKLNEMELVQRGLAFQPTFRMLDTDDLEDLEDATDEEVDQIEEEVLDQATASQTVAELKAEIATLKVLEAQALSVRRSGDDRKWTELANLLNTIFATSLSKTVADKGVPYGAGPIPDPSWSPTQKLVIFTEHRDTLRYLHERITTLLGRESHIVTIHGSIGREDRLKAQDAFRHDPEVKVLLATDAAGEGINLQRAHLMVNYDLPWNPNRLEQRFGRIHRIGQTEVCHLWNLIAQKTREGDVYGRLLEKLEEARNALGGKVYDVLGKLQFEGKSLKDLLIEAIRYGETPEVRARMEEVISGVFDQSHLQGLLEDRSLARNTMDTSQVGRIKAEMERAEARRLQPHYIEGFFLEAFSRLGGRIQRREGHRYEIRNVPLIVRSRDRQVGNRGTVQTRYERIAFSKDEVAPLGQVRAAFVCPGHPLLDATLDLTLERNWELLKRGTVLVDESDFGTEPRLLFYLEHAVRDASVTASGEQRVISKRMLHVEVDRNGGKRHVQYAPYLDYRPISEAEPSVDDILRHANCQWVKPELEKEVMAYAVSQVAKEHLDEIKKARIELLDKTEAAVKDRLMKEINHWDYRASELKAKEEAGQSGMRLSAGEARRRADDLQVRLRERLNQLGLERKISPASPVVMGGLLVVPIGLLKSMMGISVSIDVDKLAVAAKAREVVMEEERKLGYEPRDVELEKLGYDVESRDPVTSTLRFIEVKGRRADAETITVTRNEILYSLNKPDHYILAIVAFDEHENHTLRYVRRPFEKSGVTSDFNGASVNFPMGDLMKLGQAPS